MLANKTIVLGITGGIAAYKAADLASKLTQAGARVDVIMTESACKFITPLTLRNITGRPVVTDMFELASEFSVEHIALADAADAVVIAPATANTIAKLAAGIADDMLGCVVLATRAPVIVAPAMHTGMWEKSITVDNVSRLKSRGFTIVDPAHGRLASGGTGVGRLADTETILGAIRQVMGKAGDLSGRRIVVTAGGTQEPIDPVRFISNRSSGKMGYALAEAARDRGAEVKLIAAATAIPDPPGISVTHVGTAAEMKKAVAKAVAKADALIMAAAVADFQPKAAATQKIKKGPGATGLTLKLIRTPDILAEVKGDFVRVGFAAESEDVIANAKKKLKSKHLDLIVANDITRTDSGFGTDTNKCTLIDARGKTESLPLLSKREVAEKILDRVVGMIRSSTESSPEESVLVELKPACFKYHYIHIPAKYSDKFPADRTKVQLETDDMGVIETAFYPREDGGPGFHRWDLHRWFEAHTKLKPGDKVRITRVEPLKFRLEIVNKGES